MYWTPMQLDLYKDLIKSEIPLTIDATGSVVQRFRRSNGDSGAIFLYQAVMQGQVGIFPVCQILSEKHDTNMISYWLKEWLRCGAAIPKETVTDYSLALLNGVSLAFNECSFKAYIQTCTQCLSVEKNSSIPPNYFIRVDIAHTIKMVTRWKCFNGKPVKIKDFYLRCIGVMTTCISKKESESTISALLIIALCEADDTRSECGSRQKFLLDSIRTFSIEKTDTNLDDPELNDLFESLHQESSTGLPNFGSIKSYAESITEESRKLERPNPYYLPEIVTPFLRLCQYFPLWTNIMSMTSRTKYNSASSARSETYFNNLENNSLNDEGKPLRADKFLIKHIRSITGLCKLERAAYNAHLNRSDTSSSSESDDFPDVRTVTRSDDHLDESSTAGMYRTEQLEEETSPRCNLDSSLKPDDHKNKISEVDATVGLVFPEKIEDHKLTELHSVSIICKPLMDHLNEEENWRGRNKTAVRNKCKPTETCPPKREKYLRPCPDVELILRRPLRRRRENNIQHGGSVVVGKQKIRVNYTCPFDSTIELLATACAHSSVYKTTLETHDKHLIFCHLILHYMLNNLSNAWYVEKAVFLSAVLNKHGSMINCDCNISVFLEQVLAELPSAIDEGQCPSCENKVCENVSILQITSKPILDKGLKMGLQESIDSCYSNSNTVCKTCKTRIALQRIPQNRLFIDTEHAFLSELSKQLGLPNAAKVAALADIPCPLFVDSARYQLIGVIHFIPPQIVDGVGHYVAYCRRLIGSWEERDSLKTKTVHLPEKSLFKVFVEPVIVCYMRVSLRIMTVLTPIINSTAINGKQSHIDTYLRQPRNACMNCGG